MKYKRMTIRETFGMPFCAHQVDNDCSRLNCNECPEIINRLAELEDKIENRTLVELPCKVGDTVYEIDYNQEACYECHCFSTFYGMDSECEKGFDIYPDLNKSKIVCDKHFLEVSPTRFSLEFYEKNMKSFNKTWFLTKAEAEKRLEKLRGNKNGRI